MTYSLSRPALIASISYVILGLMILLPFDAKSQSVHNNTFGYRLFLLIIMMIPISLSVYSINCMMVGHCIVWSYVQAIAIAFWVILFATATLVSSERQRDVSLT